MRREDLGKKKKGKKKEGNEKSVNRKECKKQGKFERVKSRGKREK